MPGEEAGHQVLALYPVQIYMNIRNQSYANAHLPPPET
jgi:hypothetical protein